MRLSRHHGQLRWITEISVTPLLDLVFILLFAFMVALPLVSRTDDLLSIPATANARGALIETPAETITLTLLPSEAVIWNDLEVPLSELEGRLIDSLKSQPKLGVVLEVPATLPVSCLVFPMAALQNCGVQSTAIRLTHDSQ